MNLQEFFAEYPKVALGFSGGVDSAFLFYAAKKYGADVKAYFVKSQFQPEFELEDARRLAEFIGADFTILECDALADDVVRKNPADRCYYCKSNVFGKILEAAKADGYNFIIDGTNASDDAADRPGMKSLQEMKILSPLRLCGLTKSDVRNLSKEAGLFTWNKPSYACLATRIPTDEEITNDKLATIEAGEDALFALGFSDFRIRLYHGAARIQMPADQMLRAVEMRDSIKTILDPLFTAVMLDLKER